MGRLVDASRGPIVVASAADGPYALPLAVMLQSALRSLDPGRTLSLHLFDMGLTERDRDRVAAMCADRDATIAWYDASSLALEQLPLTRRMTTATYARLALATLLPADVENVIWLDADVVVTADLARLWGLDVTDRHLLAVQDPCVPFVSSRYGVRRWRELRLPPRAKYFNAGVMLINVDRWRRDETGERAAEYLLRSGGNAMFWDQEGLNAVLCERWGELDSRWNYCSGFTPREQPGTADVEPWIIHFAGRLKPWLLVDPGTGHRGLFYDVLEETAWAGWRPRPTAASLAQGWYESSRVRDVLYPAEHWWMLYLSSRLRQAASLLQGRSVV